jgi:peptidase M48-like protein
MKRSLVGQLGTLIVAASLLSPAALARPIQQSSTPTPSQQQSGSSQSGQQPSTAPAQGSQQPQSGQQTNPPQTPTPQPEQTSPPQTPTPTPQPEKTSPSAQTAPQSGQQPPVSQTSKPDESTAQDLSAPGTGDKNPDTMPIQQMPADPNVKAGSKQDVNAIGNRSVGHGLNFYSLEHEIALGKQLSQEVEKQAKFINDPVVNEYVNRVGQNLVRNSDAQVPFTIKVIDSDVVNAFALQGGFFYVNSGLILHADEESELAGVMAHEIAHVCARHGTKQATKSDIIQMGAMVATIFIPYTWAGYAIYQGMQFAIPMTFLKFTRVDEAEADYLGLQYMYKAGYDPNAFVSFFEKVQADEKKQPGTIPKVFSTHPPTPDRIVKAQNEIATILPAREEYIVTTSEFDTVKRRLQMIEMNMKVDDKKNPNKPSLRKKTDQNPNKGSTGGSDPQSTSSDPTSTDEPDRPTLQRRPDPNAQP